MQKSTVTDSTQCHMGAMIRDTVLYRALLDSTAVVCRRAHS